MGLLSVQNQVVGTPNSSQKYISGGQRRRLSIAQELIGFPSAIFLDEPTSGLDASNSLRIIRLLHFISRKRGTSVILTIHQPRSEVFEMFDSLILLGQGGEMVYSGNCRNAHALLSSCLSLPPDSIRCDNPGDFIIDVLGLESENESKIQDCLIECSEHNTSLHTPIDEFDSLIAPRKKVKPDLSKDLSAHFLQSTEYIMLLKRIEEDIEILRPRFDFDFSDFGVRIPIHQFPLAEQIVNEGEKQVGGDCEESYSDEELKSSPMVSSVHSDDHRFQGKLNVLSCPQKHLSLPTILSDDAAGRSSQSTGNWIEVRILQLWVLFTRRLLVKYFLTIVTVSRCSNPAHWISYGAFHK